MHTSEKVALRLFGLLIFAYLVFGDLNSRRNLETIDNELEHSLYNTNDSFLLTSHTYADFFNNVNGNKSLLVQFYNHWCSHCQTFRDIWLEFRFHIGKKWSNLIEFGVVNCAKTSFVCKMFSVTGTPTVIYFPPKSVQIKDNKLKTLTEILQINHATRLKMLQEFLQVIKRNSSYELCPSLNLHRYDELPSYLDNNEKHVFYITNNSSDIEETILDFCDHSSYKISLISLTQYDPKLFYNNTLYYHTTSELEQVASFGQKTIANPVLKSVILKFLKSKLNQTFFNESTAAVAAAADNITINGFLSNQTTTVNYPVIKTPEELITQLNTIRLVKQIMSVNRRDFIFLQDLKKALNYSISHELNCLDDMSRKTAQNFLNYVYDYFPLSDREKIAIEQVISYIHNKDCDPIQNVNVFNVSTLEWIGCISSSNSRPIRGYTCGLWQTFHYLTIKAHSINNDSKNVLMTIRDYVKYFFGCQECKNHFLEMEKLDSIDKIKSDQEAILWLWRKHNLVNDRLHQQKREDPEFPKIQYPNQLYCAECFDNNFTKWNDDAVFSYLIKTYTNPKKGSYDDVLKEYQASNYRLKREMRGTIVLNNYDISLFFVIYVASIILSICVYQYFVGRKLWKNSRFRQFAQTSFH